VAGMSGNKKELDDFEGGENDSNCQNPSLPTLQVSTKMKKRLNLLK
jgi:hypothetical protein